MSVEITKVAHSAILARAKILADMEFDDSLVTDTEAYHWIVWAIGDLYDIANTASDFAFCLDAQEITLGSRESNNFNDEARHASIDGCYELSTDVGQITHVELVADGSTYTLRPYSFTERNNVDDTGLDAAKYRTFFYLHHDYGQTPPTANAVFERYIRIIPTSATGTLRVWFVKDMLSILHSDYETGGTFSWFEGLGGNQIEYICTLVAIRMRMKAGIGTEHLELELPRLEERMRLSFQNFDSGIGERVLDTSNLGDRFGQL